jgi:hypothetical protein
MPIEPERQRLAAALEQLEAEQRRREDEKVANGEAVRRPLYVVAHNGEPVADLIEHAKAREAGRPAYHLLRGALDDTDGRAS